MVCSLLPALSQPTGAAAPADAHPGLRVDAPVPNPATGRTTARVDVPAAQALRVTVLDALGRTVATLHDGPAVAGPLALHVDVSALAPGVYVVRVSGETATVQTRLVVR